MCISVGLILRINVAPVQRVRLVAAYLNPGFGSILDVVGCPLPPTRDSSIPNPGSIRSVVAWDLRRGGSGAKDHLFSLDVAP